MTFYPNSDRRVPLGRPNKYDWDAWTDGQERYLKEGEDFSSMAESFILLARRTARVRGLHITASIITIPEKMTKDQAELGLGPGTYVSLQFTE